MPTDHPTPSPAPASGAGPTCEYAKSSMTPCVRRDGNLARADNGECVGCGWDAATAQRTPPKQAPTPPSDAGTSERETGLGYCDVGGVRHDHLHGVTADCRGFLPAASHPAAPAAEGPRPVAPCVACGREMFCPDPANRPDMWACTMWGCTFRHVAPAAALPGAEAGTPKGESGTAERTRWMVETEAGRADTIERCKYASDGPSHLITAFARHCTALTSEVARLTEERDAARDAMVRYSDYYDREVEHNTALIAERRALTSEVRALTVRAESAESALDEAWGAAIEVSDEVSTSGAWESKGTQTYAIGAARWLSIAKKIHALRYALAARLASPSPTGAP